MSFEFSEFGCHLGTGSGIGELMDDLGQALTKGLDVHMLGGGQPAQIPAMDEVWRDRLQAIVDDPNALGRSLTLYDPPRGNPEFLEAIAKLFRETFGWPITEENVAVTCGGQTAFYFLLNLLAGRMPNGERKRIMLPLVPEYIGYANQGVAGDLFRAVPPRIEKTGPHEFKYHVDFDRLEITPEIAALCASRPTNPTGNVLTNEEVARLSELAKAHGIPLILDNAYGLPFPGIIFNDDAVPFWQPHVILTLSLSKIGLPGTRTGIVIGPPEITRALESISAIAGLANPNIGQQIITPLLESGEVLRLSREVVRPYYEEKARLARLAAIEAFGDADWHMHDTEGALFLWLWFPSMTISSTELYQRLKQRGVLIIPGNHFFFGLEDESWPHRHQCIRVSYAMDECTVREGLAIIAEEVRKASPAS